MLAPTSLQNATVADLGERALIARITARLAMPAWVVVGPGDDAAVVALDRGALQVLTTDAVVDGVHFDRRFVPPEAIGHRSLAVNLSDLSAMGAKPRAALLSLILPESLEVAAIDRMVDGILALADRYRVAVVGGNVTRTPGPLTLDVTAIGSVRPRRMLTRTGARPGDEVYVTGTIGDAAVGLRTLQSGGLGADTSTFAEATVDGPASGDAGPASTEAAGRRAGRSRGLSGVGPTQERYLLPEPRVRAGVLLGRNRAASSCIDLSDGLADGIRQIAEASGVGITIDAASIPLSDSVRRWHDSHGSDPIETALIAGDDYELLFTVRPANLGRFRGVRRELGDLPITRIGTVTKGRELQVRDEHGTRPLPAGFEHFR